MCLSRLLLLLLLHSLCAASADLTTLTPFHYINKELIELDTEVKAYLLADLKPSTGYEVRLSWPASIPATVKFQIVDGSAGGQAAAHKPIRRLLDCEKLTFSTDSQGAVQGWARPQVLVTAARRSVHRDGPKAGVSKAVYNIVLAELVLGLPKDSVPTVAAVVAVVLAALFWSLYWSYSLFPRLVLWITSPAARPAAAGETKRHS